MTTIVSAFLTNVNSHRSIEKYVECGKKLCRANVNKVIFIEEHVYNDHFNDEAYPTTTFYFICKEELYLYKYADSLPNFKDLHTDNPKKDTPEYMFVQNNKTEWVRDAINKNPFNDDQFIWIDFGIYHMIENEQIFTNIIHELKNKSYENIRIASGKYYKASSIYTRIHWVFLGSIFGGNSKKLLEFADLTRQKCEEIIKNGGTIMWEINVWYLVHLEFPNLFDPYKAVHNASIISEY